MAINGHGRNGQQFWANQQITNLTQSIENTVMTSELLLGGSSHES